MGAVDPSQVGGDIKKNLWLTLEDLFEGGLKHIVAHVRLSLHLKPDPRPPKFRISHALDCRPQKYYVECRSNEASTTGTIPTPQALLIRIPAP
jgi:hypothetical protein